MISRDEIKYFQFYIDLNLIKLEDEDGICVGVDGQVKFDRNKTPASARSFAIFMVKIGDFLVRLEKHGLESEGHE